MEEELKKSLIWCGIIFIIIASVGLALIILSYDKDDIKTLQYESMSIDQQDDPTPIKTTTRPYFG